MSNYANTKATIAANVYENHLNQVTANMAKAAINAVVDSLIAGGFLYKGVAHPGDAAVSPDANVFYIASEAGTYTNKGGLVVADGEVAILKYNGSWSKEVTGAATAAEVSALGQKVSANKFPNYTTQGYILSLSDPPNVGKLTALGEIDSTQTSYKTSDFIPTDCIERVTFYRAAGTDGIQVYDKDFSLLASIGWSSGDTLLDLTQYPSGKYIRVSAYSSAFSLNVAFDNYAEKHSRIYFPFSVSNGYVSPTTGNITAHANYIAFSFKVRAGVSYTFPQFFSGASTGFAFLDKFGVFVSGGTLSGSVGSEVTITAPEYSATLRVTCEIINKSEFSVKVDLSTLVNAPDDYSITENKIAEGAVSPGKTTFVKISENVNLIRGWESGYIDADGVPQSSGTLYRTTEVLLSPNKSYYIRGIINGYYAFYDIDGNVLASYGNGSGQLSPQPVTPPANTHYGRFTISNDTYKERAYISIVDRKCSAFTREIEHGISLFGGSFCNYNGREASVFNKGIAIGDSLTQGVFNHNEGGTEEYLVDTKYSWPSVFKKLSGIEMTNKGIGGYSSVDWWTNKGGEDLSGHDFAVVSFGVNDVSQFGGWTTAVESAYTNIINKLKTDNPGIKIFVSTIFPAIAYDSVALRVTFCKSIRAFVSGLADDNVILLDLQKYGHTRDFVPYNAGHLSALGYSTLASDIYSLISYIIKMDKENYDDVQFVGTNYSWSN